MLILPTTKTTTVPLTLAAACKNLRLLLVLVPVNSESMTLADGLTAT